MTVKEFFTGFFYSPAIAFSGLTNLLLGSYKRDTDDNIKKASTAESNTNPGILGYFLNAVMYVARGVSNFIYNHKTAIATAFWASLVLAGAAALTVFLWPAALTAVATFSIYGLSIAGIVGAEAAAQIGAIAALTFVATSVATYVGAGVVNTINWLISCCKPTTGQNQQQTEPTTEPTLTEEAPTNVKGSAATLAKLQKEGAIPVIAKTAEEQAKLDAESKAKLDAEKKQANGSNVKLFQQPKQEDAPVVDTAATVACKQ